MANTPSTFPGATDTFAVKADFSSTVAADDPNHIQNAVVATQNYVAQIAVVAARAHIALGL